MQGREKDIKIKKIKKEVKGITLVALVVTIIVLLILAGVAIGLGIGDNGIIGGAENITEKWKEAEAGEKGTLENTAGYLNDLSKELNGVTALEIFDETWKEEGKLQVGDFINYTAGT